MKKRETKAKRLSTKTIRVLPEKQLEHAKGGSSDAQAEVLNNPLYG